MLRTLLPRIGALLGPMAVALVIHACSDSTGPSGGGLVMGPRASFSVVPSFQTGGPSGIVQFERVRVLIRRTDGTIALDTLIDFPVGASEVALTLSVPLSASAPAAGEDFSLDLEMLNAAGEVVFRGGPITVRAVQGTPPPAVNIPTTYTGPGATATRVEVTPSTGVLAPGATLNLTATAFDAANAPLLGTPVQWTSSNSAVASLSSPTQGQVSGVARGTATITAQLVTGQTAQAVISVRPPASGLSVESGSGQTGVVGLALAAPLTVKVTAADGLGVEGTEVSFSIVTGGGSLSSATATTNASGVASVAYTAGTVPGPVVITATVAGLAGSPASITATTVAGAATTLAFSVQPTGAESGSAFAPFFVEARDAFGNVATGYTGTVTLALEGGTALVLDGRQLAAATLGGVFSAPAANGVAAFASVIVEGAVVGGQFRASGEGIEGSVLSAAFTVSPLAATQLALASPPVIGSNVVPTQLIVEARNGLNLLAPAFTGTVTALLVSGPTGGLLSGVVQAEFTAGVAQLGLLFSLPGTYVVLLTTDGLTTLQVELVIPSTNPQVTWNGSTSADWSTAANWTPAMVPTVTTDVVIPVYGTGNFDPVITTAAVARHLTVQAGGVLQLQEGDLHVNGNVVLGANASIVYYFGGEDPAVRAGDGGGRERQHQCPAASASG